MGVARRLSWSSYKTLRGLLLANLVYQSGLALLYLMVVPRVSEECFRGNSMVVLISISTGIAFEVLLVLFFLLEVVTTILFLIFKNRPTALMAITVPWSFPILAVLEDPSSLMVLLFIPIPFMMGMHLPFWDCSEDDWMPKNPLPATPYQGPPR